MSEDTPLNQWSLDELCDLRDIVTLYSVVKKIKERDQFCIRLLDVIKTAISDAEQLEEERWVNGFVLPDEMRRNKLKTTKR